MDKHKSNRQLQTKSDCQAALADAQNQALNKYSSGKITHWQYMAYMQMVTFSFKPIKRYEKGI